MLALPASVYPEYKGVFNPLLGCRVSSWSHTGRATTLGEASWARRVDRRLAVEFLLATWITFGKRSEASWKGSLGRAGRAARGGQARWQGPSLRHASLVCGAGRPRSCARKEDPGLPSSGFWPTTRKTTSANIQEDERGRCLPGGGHLPFFFEGLTF